MRTLTMALAAGSAACDAPRNETALDQVNTESREAVDNTAAAAAKTDLNVEVQEFRSRSGVIAQPSKKWVSPVSRAYPWKITASPPTIRS